MKSGRESISSLEEQGDTPMVMTGRTILGVFDKPAMADQAIDALQTAGFSNNQIHVAGHHASGGFMAGLKHFFTGDDMATGPDASDFTGMGISDEETHYEAGRGACRARG